MSDQARDADFLRGKQVAFTGKLASMTRQEAAELVRAFGGTFVPALGRHTSILVVGQEGWPLREDGQLTRQLRRAQVLQRRGRHVTVLSEEELLTRLGLDSRSDEIRRRCTTAELIRILKIPRERLRAWIGAGLIVPVESSQGVGYFDFRQVAGAKTLCDLVKAGISTDRVRRSLEHLRAWAGDVDQPLEQLAILEKDGDILVRLGDQLADATGQLRFDFSEQAEESTVAWEPSQRTAEEWFDLACEHEDAGRLVEGENAYRQALLQGPNPECSFNLANLLYTQGRKPESAERFYQVVELDRTHAEAWNNLGTVLVDLRRLEEAKAAYEKAIGLGYADAHYNLADLLADLGDEDQARKHLQAYLQQDQHSRWARYARARLEKRSR
jgi:tetratricopeptide (TPR) repeat protein